MYWINRLLSLLSMPFRHKQTAGSNVLILQPLPGIGDMVWHLPALNALAEKYGPLTVMTKARSLADQLLDGNVAVDSVVWLERSPGKHDGLLGLMRLVADLRRIHPREAWVMHCSARYTFALYLAGVKKIIAPGRGAQKLFSDPAMWLKDEQLKTHPIQRAESMLKRAGIPLAKHEGCLKASSKYIAQVQHEYPQNDLIMLGIGSSEPDKQWGAKRFSELADLLLLHNQQVVLLGGEAERSLCEEIIHLTKRPGLQHILAKPLPFITALLASARAYVGNDTGIMNMALASGITTFGLFGASPPLNHAENLYAIQPRNLELGMSGIRSQDVFSEISDVLNLKP